MLLNKIYFNNILNYQKYILIFISSFEFFLIYSIEIFISTFELLNNYLVIYHCYYYQHKLMILSIQ